jgi:hypothetical protein
MAIFLLGRPINRNSLGPGSFEHYLKDEETSEKKKTKRKRLPRQPFSITANAITRLLSVLLKSW